MDFLDQFHQGLISLIRAISLSPKSDRPLLQIVTKLMLRAAPKGLPFPFSKQRSLFTFKKKELTIKIVARIEVKKYGKSSKK
jgi:hypothetical protein